jgi:uncharacterized protein (TIGR00730 family)
MNICVYCGASRSVNGDYLQLARDFGARLAKRGDTLIYGGASIGMMGEVARAVHAGGGRVVGVIPQALVDKEVSYHAADELIITDDMRQRKAVMDARSDAFVALPGGLGTLEEITEIMNQRGLKISLKPLVLLNLNNFYAPLFAFFRHLESAGFLHRNYQQLYHPAPDLDDAFAFIDSGAGYHVEGRY